jgi:hypothetical protein
MNRGLSRRPLFDLPSDKRRFLALLACAVRSGRIRVHCFCLMDTHYHLVVESLDGKLSATMGWLQSRHGAHYNRTRGRDGPLVRGRFKSIPVNSRVYFFVLVRYGDFNAVEAGLCSDPLDYEFASARLHANSARQPRWLSRELIGRALAPLTQQGISRELAYRSVFHRGRAEAGSSAGLVTARIEHLSRTQDDLDEFARTDGSGRRAWLMKRAFQADGTRPGLPMADAGSVRRTVEIHRVRAPAAGLRSATGATRDLWNAAEVGLLRDLAGLGYAAMARELGLGLATIRKRYGHHREGLRQDEPYVVILGELARQSLEHCLGLDPSALSAELASTHVSRWGTKIA